jgi:hypothetical protein
MRVRNAIVMGLLAAAGVAVFADDAQAFGRRRKAASSCGGCGGGYSSGYAGGYSGGYAGGYGMQAMPSSPCGGCGSSGYSGVMPGGYVGDVNQGGNVIVSGESGPSPMPNSGIATTGSTIPATNLTVPGTTVIPGTTAGTVISPQYVGGYQGGVIQTGGYVYPGTTYGYPGTTYGYPGMNYGNAYGSQSFQGGLMNGALGVPQYYTPGTTVQGAVGNAVGRGLFRR